MARWASAGERLDHRRADWCSRSQGAVRACACAGPRPAGANQRHAGAGTCPTAGRGRATASTDLGLTDPWAVVAPTTNTATTISYTFPGTTPDDFARLKVTQ